MSAKAARESAVVLRGPPGRLSAVAPLPAAVASRDAAHGAAAEISILVAGAEPEQVRIRGGRGQGNAQELRVRLAPSTPPGTYEGVATVGERTVPVRIEVEPAVRLRAVPSRVELRAEPRGTAAVEIRLTNGGNIPVDVPARASFCLFDGGGIDHAVWAALTTEPPKGKGRMDVLLDDLAASHGGLVDVRVRGGAGSLAPGESRTCLVDLGWSDRLRPGRRYLGAWDVAGLRIPVRVETASKAPARSRSARSSRRTA